MPFEFDVHAMILSEDAPSLETRLHKHFVDAQVNKVNHRKEFFRVDLKHVKQEIEGLGISAQWTMSAAAAQYKETQAIEKAIKANPAMREAWIKRQLELDMRDLALGDGNGENDGATTDGAGVEVPKELVAVQTGAIR